jgi:hypothetical protein
MATVDDARAIASTLPRSYEAIVRDRLEFRVGRIVHTVGSGQGVNRELPAAAQL